MTSRIIKNAVTGQSKKKLKNDPLIAHLPTVSESSKVKRRNAGVKRQRRRPVAQARWRPNTDQEIAPWTLGRANVDGSVTIFCGDMYGHDLNGQIADEKGAYLSESGFLEAIRMKRAENGEVGCDGGTGKAKIQAVSKPNKGSEGNT